MTLTCFALSSTHFDDDNGSKFAHLARNVKNLIETWEDLSVSHKKAHALTKRLEVRKFEHQSVIIIRSLKSAF